MKRTFLIIKTQFIYVFVVALLFVIVASGYNSKEIVTNDLSSVRSIQAIHLVSKYKKEEIITNIKPIITHFIKRNLYKQKQLILLRK